MLPSTITTLNTAFVEPSGDLPRNAVPTAPRLSPPDRTCVGILGVRLPANTPPVSWFGALASGAPFGSRIVDVPIPQRPIGALAGHRRPNALLIEKPSGLLTPVKPAVTAFGVLVPLRNAGLCALYNCARPPRMETCPPAAAKSRGITRMSVPRGSMDRKDPCR